MARRKFLLLAFGTQAKWDRLIREACNACGREGIAIPFPQRDVHLYTENKD